MANKRAKIDPKLIDELLAGQDPQTILTSEGLLGELKKALAERMLDAEMDVHLEFEDEQTAGNHRNGRSGKRVLTETGAIPLSIPRDRHSRFEPKLIEKYKRRFPGFDEKIIALYARGMSTRDIQAHIRELYGLEISPDLVSAVTDAVHDEVIAWQSWPLETTYAIIFFDALRVKIRDEGTVRNKAVHLAIGVRVAQARRRYWACESNSPKAPSSGVMTEFKNRGTRDILIAVVDGLGEVPEAIEGVLHEAEVQTCIVHLIRYSMQFASWKEHKATAKALRPIYQAETAELATERLEKFDHEPWGEIYPAIA